MMFSNSGIRTRMGIAGIAREEAQAGLCIGNNSMKKLILAVCSLVFVMLQWSVASAEESGFIENRQCFGCHKTQKQTYQDSVHGRAFSADAMAGCQSCHGGGAAHNEVAGEDNYTGPLKIESFKKGSGTDDKSRICLTCHQKDARRMNWMGSAHQSSDVDCTSCHQMHTAQDKVRDKRTQPEVCYTCHKERRAQAKMASHHPIDEGKVVCSNCHNPHGSNGPTLLLKSTVGETCFLCHAEKRGPFLWEHPPVSDNCLNCHNPHGTNNASMLKTRPPYLCAQCHIAGGHSTTGIRSGYDLGAGVTPGGAATAAPQMAGKACLNCHTQIHGSNHPSGARFVR